MLQNKKHAFYLCNISILILGFNAIFAKIILLSAEHIILGRALVAACCLGLYLKQQNIQLRPKSKRTFIYMLGLALLMGIHWIAMFKAIKVSNVALALVAVFTFPMFTTLLEPIVLKKRFKPRYLISAILVLIGILVMDPSIDLDNNISQGILWGLISAISFALRNIYTRKYIHHIPASKLMFYQSTIVAILLSPLLVTIPSTFRVLDIVLILVLGSIFTALAHTLFSKSLERLSASFVGILSCIQPIYGSTLAFLIIKEVPSKRTLLGGVIILTVVIFHSIHLYIKQKNKIENKLSPPG
ncbi:MAG: DMT family transporter [bacterium]